MASPAGARAVNPNFGVQPVPGPRLKILRIGVVQGGRIVEERLVRKRENITVGQSARNTFVIPSDALPRQWVLFEIRNGRYVAHFSEGMDARIGVGNDIHPLAALKQMGKLVRSGPGWMLPLDERARGKITAGDLTILFQFVTPPPPQPRPQLPVSVRGSITSDLDWFFTSVAIASFVLHLVLVLYLRNVDWPRKPDIETIPDRFVQMVVKKKEEKPVEQKQSEDKTEDKNLGKDKPKKTSAPKRELTEADKQAAAEAKARADADRRARLAQQVQQMGVLKLLGARGGDGSIADVLGKGDVDRDQEKAFQGVGGVGVAHGGEGLRGIKGGGGGGTGKVASVDGLRGGGSIAGGGTGAGVGERSVKAIMRTEAPAVDGALAPDVIVREVKAKAGAVKACYEKALKRNPNLSGKVVVHWTITAAGTVSGVDIETDTVGDSEVTGCIKSMISRWRFPAPANGAVDVSFPFVFSAAQ